MTEDDILDKVSEIVGHIYNRPIRAADREFRRLEEAHKEGIAQYPGQTPGDLFAQYVEAKNYYQSVLEGARLLSEEMETRLRGIK